MKNGVRNMRRWDTEIPVIRRERPDLQILSCHDEYLLHTMFDVDGALVGYGGLAPEPLIEMIAAGKAKDYAKARAIHDRLLPVTKPSTTAARTWRAPSRSSTASSPAASWSTPPSARRCCRSTPAPRSRSRTRCARPDSLGQPRSAHRRLDTLPATLRRSGIPLRRPKQERSTAIVFDPCREEVMSVLVADGGALPAVTAASPFNSAANAQLVARLERLPVTRRLMLLRIIVGIATFFDAYTVLAIAFAMPQLVTEWKLTPPEVGIIISAGYVGQLFGAVIFGSLAEKFGRLTTLFITIVLFVSMDIACLFAWSGASMMVFRFLQGIGTGGEVPVASAYINEFIGAEKRGRFFLLYEVIFPIGLMFAGMVGFFLVPDLRLEGAVHRRPRPVGPDHPAALVHARVAALARLQGPHCEGRRRREDARERRDAEAAPSCASRVMRPIGPRPPRTPTGASCSRASTSSAR